MRTLGWTGSPEQWREVVRTLQFEHFKWDAHVGGRCRICDHAIALSRQEHGEIVRLVARFDQILGKMELALAGDNRWLERLGIPENVRSLVSAATAHARQFARYDVFPLEEGGWMISEFNEDVPGGFNEAEGLREILGGSWNGHVFEGNLRQALLGALGSTEKVGLLHATGYAEDLQHMLVVAKWLREESRHPVLASPAHLRSGWRGTSLLGERCGSFLRFYPGEWFEHLPNLRVWRKTAPDLHLLNPFRRLIRQSKLLFAYWAEAGVLDSGELAFVRQHSPHTTPYQPQYLSRWLEERERWVLKSAFGRMGDGVLIGALASPAAWEKALHAAARQPSRFCLQERFHVRSLVSSEGKKLYPCLGPYLVDGAFTGYFSRVAELPFVAHDASHAATVVHIS